MKSEDDIMAEYLLKGGKMLSKTCPSCGCPLFEYKGETFCVICREERAEAKGEHLQPVTRETQETERVSPEGHSDLASSLEETLIALSIRIRQEPDPERLMLLVNSLKRGIEALRLIS
ncbi:MAG: hypothetical protein LUO81_01875 [Methanoregulaceae archaeon]|nr:hypothetical protein [Methanoregulaceae archaeon]